MSVNLWRYEKCAPLKVDLPEGWSVEVWKVHSGDSDKSYYVQVLRGAHGTTPVESTYICNCGDAMIHGLNLVAIAGEGTGCKHSEHLDEYLTELKARKR